jgi:hypothetical protein
LEAAASRRPFEIEPGADDSPHVEIAFKGEGLDPFAPGLLDPAKGTRDSGRPRSKLLLEFAKGGGHIFFSRLDQAFWNHPGAVILALPEGAAGMDEQYFDLIAA